MAGVKDAEHAVQKILASVTTPMQVNGQNVTITVSIGFSLFPLHAQESEDLLRYADVALYRARQKKNNIQMYDPDTGIVDPSMFSEARTD